MAKRLTTKQRRFVEEYTVDFNATQAAKRAGYSERTAYSIGQENLKKPEISAAIEKRLEELTLNANALLKLQSDLARFDIGDYITPRGDGVDIQALIEDGHGKHIKSLKFTKDGDPIYEFYDKQRAQEKLISVLLAHNEKPQWKIEIRQLVITGQATIEQVEEEFGSDLVDELFKSNVSTSS